MNKAESSVRALCIDGDAPIVDVLRRLSGRGDGLPAGIALVVDSTGALLGTITDGDVRRCILKHGTLECRARDAMNATPISFEASASYRSILDRLPNELEQRGRRSQRFLGKIVLVDDANKPVDVIDYHQLWEQRVATHRRIVVVGLGYVGLTLALALADEGFQVTGVDLDDERIRRLKAQDPYVHEIGLPELLREHLGSRFVASTTLPEGGDVFVLAVGTPVHSRDGGNPKPDLDIVRSATRMVAKELRRGGLVVLRSTVPVGCCRQLVVPILEEETGLKAGRDFHVAFAPERTVEGKAIAELRSLPQIVGGLTEESVEATVALFRELTPSIVRVGSIEAAEMAKLINNAFRDHVFAFANQMAQVAAHFEVDINEVIHAANHGYPRDPVPLPSPGVGGPCLTKDPWILADVAQAASLDGDLFAQSRRVNESMHSFVATRVTTELRRLGKDPKRARVLLCGLAFKGRPETGDLRNSSAVEIAEILKSEVLEVYGHDPVASPREIESLGLKSVRLPEGFTGIDAVLFLNNHPSFERLDVFAMARALNQPAVVFDGWGAIRADDVVAAATVTYLGLGARISSFDRAHQ